MGYMLVRTVQDNYVTGMLQRPLDEKIIDPFMQVVKHLQQGV